MKNTGKEKDKKINICDDMITPPKSPRESTEDLPEAVSEGSRKLAGT